MSQTKVSGDRGRHDLFGGQRIKRSSVSVLFKEGFEEYGRRAKYYKDPIEDAILMFCEISTDDQSFPLDSSETPFIMMSVRRRMR